MYGFGVVGNMGGGVLDFIATNWIPLGKALDDICLSSSIGLIFVAIYYLFKYLILKFDIPLPGRKKGEEEVKLFSKQDYKDKKEIQLAIIHLIVNMKKRRCTT